MNVKVASDRYERRSDEEVRVTDRCESSSEGCSKNEQFRDSEMDTD